MAIIRRTCDVTLLARRATVGARACSRLFELLHQLTAICLTLNYTLEIKKRQQEELKSRGACKYPALTSLRPAEGQPIT